jgi:hypothetical protein
LESWSDKRETSNSLIKDAAGSDQTYFDIGLEHSVDMELGSKSMTEEQALWKPAGAAPTYELNEAVGRVSV